MSYKNSFKLLINNFNLVWKQLAYILCISLLSFGVCYGIASPIIKTLSEQGVLKEIGEIFGNIYTNQNQLFESVSKVWVHFSEVMNEFWGKLWLNVVGLFFFGAFFFTILRHMSTYNLTSVLNMKLTAYLDIGYTSNFIATMSDSIRYALVKFVYALPFELIKIGISIVYLTTVKSFVGVMIGLFAICLLFVLINSLELVLFTSMGIYIISNNNKMSAFKVFFVSSRGVFKKFDRVYSNAIVTTITILFVNVFFGIFTVGVGLFITVPASMVFVVLFNLTSYYGANGGRYYINESLLYKPNIK